MNLVLCPAIQAGLVEALALNEWKGEPAVCCRQRVCETGSGAGFDQAVAIISIAARARSTWARGQKFLRNRRAAWFLGSDRNFAAQHPQGAPKARRIWALTPKTPDPAFAPDRLSPNGFSVRGFDTLCVPCPGLVEGSPRTVSGLQGFGNLSPNGSGRPLTEVEK